MSSNTGNEFIEGFEGINGKEGVIDKNSDEIISRKIEIKVPENLNWSSTNQGRI